MNRTELEETVWQLPRVQESGIDFVELENMTDSELLALLGHKRPPKKEKTKREPVKRYPAPRVSFSFVVEDDRLWRLEKWQHIGPAGNYCTEHLIACGKRVQWEGRTVSSSLLRHFLTTGEWVKRAPKVDAKPLRGLIRVNGKLRHVGYFATKEERDAACGLAKLGIFPNGLK